MDNYKILKTLKKSNKSCVYSALDIRNSNKVAIKEMSNVSQNLKYLELLRV